MFVFAIQIIRQIFASTVHVLYYSIKESFLTISLRHA